MNVIFPFLKTRFTTSVVLLAMCASLGAPLMASAAAVDPVNSRASVDKVGLRADGIDNALLTVTVKDVNLMSVPDLSVNVASSRGVLDEIVPVAATTDSLGKAYFRITSLKDGVATFSVSAGGTMIQKTVSITFSQGLSFPLKDGDLIKIPDDNNASTLSDTAVYYYAKNGKRYVFPNEKVYYTWYPNFNKVQILPIDQMSLIPIGGNVTYHPGSKMVKFQTDVKTYMVTKGGVLRWAKTEDVARGWFGTSWNQQVDDISEAFYVNYKFGEPVASALDLALDVIRATVSTIDDDKGLNQ